eukprot:scaffold14704_cov214-Ochromonas_danica.AAC.1
MRIKRSWLTPFLLLLLFFLSFLLTIHSWENLIIYQHPHQKTHAPSSHPEVSTTLTGNENNLAPLPPWELDVLYDLYNSTQGEYWIWTGVPWNFSESNANPCSEAWEGVTCFEVCSNTVNGSESCGEHIYSIVLSNNNMTGSLPSSLGQLQRMHYLGLTDNLNLTGTIPSIFSNLSYLSYLMLNNNALTGTIPNSLTNARALLSLNLATNQLTGSLPGNISQLTLLQYLFVYSNYLTGSVPDELGSFSQLAYFFTYSNLITGSFPQSLAN